PVLSNSNRFLDLFTLSCWFVAFFRPLEPGGGLSVARHAPVAARRQANGADFRSVRQAGALELIAEESLDENAQPLSDFLGSVFPVEVGMLGQKQNLLGRSAVAKEVKQKEIVKLVRSDGVLGVLYSLAIDAGRQQFRRDRGRDDVQERLPGFAFKFI